MSATATSPAPQTDEQDARPARTLVISLALSPGEMRQIEQAKRADADGRHMSRVAFIRARLLAALDGGR